MSKEELVTSIAETTGVKKSTAKNIIDATLEKIANSLANGEEIRLIGFGTFSVTDVPAREAVNPKTGDPMQIAAHKKPKFKFGAPVIRAVKG